MNIALIGYGRIGKEIEKTALERGHTISLVVDKENCNDLNARNLKRVDVAIEFTTPESALDNVRKCLHEGVSVVSGTTGWLDQIDDAIAATLKGDSAFMYSSNFSVGVNIMFHINHRLSELMRGRTEYSAQIEETHHKKKLDSPSGTALSLVRTIIADNDHYSGWRGPDNKEKVTNDTNDDLIPIISRREGNVPGTHEVMWKSEVDCISLHHEAFGREGFAHGAVLAAEYVNGKSGFLTMRDMLGF